MPEQPALDALTAFLRNKLVGETIAEARLAEISALKTARIPLDQVVGATVVAVSRIGKYLDLAVGEHHLVVHFALMGWLRWYASVPDSPVRIGNGPLALRVFLESGAGFDLTEQGTKKSLSVHLVSDLSAIERLQDLGPDVRELTEEAFADIVAGKSSRIKTVLRDQLLIAGIGNRWSDEILWEAQLSPFTTASAIKDPTGLFLAMRTVLDRATQGLQGLPPNKIKAGEKSLSRVHGRTGEKCSVCGSTISQVVYTDRSFQYCPGCQTDGRHLSDRRMDRLLK